jgi:hypothetical protein
MPLSNFAYASVLTEALLLGNLALRTGAPVEWHAETMHAGNAAADAYIRPTFRAGWSLE